MKALYDVPAPAKLNLFLHVTGRRPDGMHLLQSAFMLIDWCDTLHFELRAGRRASAAKTWARPCRRTTWCCAPPAPCSRPRARRMGAHIAIEKRLPAQAGMGGGSSDAASCLLALNRLWGLDCPLPALAQIGLALGADVPFFLGGRNAWVEGVGERLTPVDAAAGPVCGGQAARGTGHGGTSSATRS